MRTLERQVISAMLAEPLAVAEVQRFMQPQDFSDPRLELVYQAIIRLVDAGSPLGVPSVADALLRDGDLARIGGEALLWEITSETVTWVNAGYYAEKVHEFGVRRRVAAVGRGLIEQAETRLDLEPEQIRQEARDSIDSMVPSGTRSHGGLLSDITAEMFDTLDQVATYKPSPWRDLNALIDGWQPGRLYVIGARPGAGKTTMGLQAASWLAAEAPVLFLSMEMSRAELWIRMFANVAGVTMTPMTRHALSREQWTRLATAREAVEKMPVHVMDGGYRGIADLRRVALEVKRDRGGVSAIICDYLGLMLERGRPPWEAMSELTAELKKLARELEVPVIALSQLNRNSASGERQPTLGDLRAGGSVEQDADVVLLLQYDDQDVHGVPVLNVNVAKNRHGKVGEFQLGWEGQHARLSNL